MEEAFTLKEVVVEIRDDVKLLSAKLDRIDRDGSIGTRQELIDHEARLRTLETSGFRLQGAWATIGIIAATVAGLAGLAIGIVSAVG